MYIDIDEYCVAYNAKAGCTSFSRAIISRYFPQHEGKVAQFYADGKSGPIAFMHCKRVKYAYKPVVLLVRNPVDRFLSAINQVQIDDIDQALDALERRTTYKLQVASKPTLLYQDIHFKRQSALLSHTNHLFKFPEHINEAAEFLGLGEIEKLNTSKRDKLSINSEQLSRILNLYRIDNELYNLIAEPNTRLKSKVRVEWDQLYHDFRIAKGSVDGVKRFVSRHPFVRSLVAKDIIEAILADN